MIMTVYYAGITVAERFNSEYKQIKTICKYNSYSVGQSIYSYKSSLMLVIYWYNGYSKINTSVIISQTKCKSVLYRSMLDPLFVCKTCSENIMSILSTQCDQVVWC